MIKNRRRYMAVISKTGLLILLFVFVFTACTAAETEAPAAVPSDTVAPPTQTALPPTETPIPTLTNTPTSTPVPDPVCMLDVFPAGYDTSSAVEGMKRFTAENNFVLRYVYFPQTCSLDAVEQDFKLLFFGDIIKDNEVALLLLDPWYEGSLAKLYQHLSLYDFWAMGPEDYPVVLEQSEGIETNIVVFRTERMNGEGWEGNALLGMMIGLSEHEYIHTVQGRNNRLLAEMIWSDGVYRAYIERYANIGNNSGQRYYRASYTLMTLLQVLDGLNTQGVLTEKIDAYLREQGSSMEEYLANEVLIYNKHLRTYVINTAGNTYMDQLLLGEISPLIMVERSGCGDLMSYNMVKYLYDNNVADYNYWFYVNNQDQYLPERFDILFDPN